MKINGPLLILAGAGTGKTATLVARCAYMIEKNIAPKSILLLTFTNKAAKEMKERVTNQIGPKAKEITACTFHSFCATMMRQYAKFFNLRSDFTILDSTDAHDAISVVRQEFLDDAKKKNIKYNLKDFVTINALQSIYENNINNCSTYLDVIKTFYPNHLKYVDEVIDILSRYVEYKNQHNLMDYNDLLYYFARLLSDNEGVRKYLDEKYKYIMCDEYQDTNIIQAKILELLSRNYNNLAVVGDDNQSIYSFRGAYVGNILEFESKYNATKIILKENYRTSQEILNFCNATMKHSSEGIPKELHGQFHGLKPQLISVTDTFHQNQHILKTINTKCFQGLKYKDMAVIVRSARQTNYLELELTKNNIPYKKFGGLKYFERAAVKDILAFIKVILNYNDELSWFRILQHYPGIGSTFANKISKKISENSINVLNSIYTKRKFAPYLHEIYTLYTKLSSAPLNKQVGYLIDKYYFKLRNRELLKSNVDESTKSDMYQSLLEDLKELEFLKEIAFDYDDTIDFLNDITLDAALPQEDDDYLNITTIHSAKGLEYQVVFMPDVIEEVTPSCPKGHPDDAEELRCFYVAITRAKKELYLYVPEFSTSTYKKIIGIKSHFIDYNDCLSCLQKNIEIKHHNKVFYFFDYVFSYDRIYL